MGKAVVTAVCRRWICGTSNARTMPTPSDGQTEWCNETFFGPQSEDAKVLEEVPSQRRSVYGADMITGSNRDSQEASLPRFLVPVPSLEVPRVWPVGRVTFHPPSESERLLADRTLAGSAAGDLGNEAIRILDQAEGGCIAEVSGAADIDDVIDTLRGSLDALRLLQLARRMTRTTSFGLPGDLYESRVRYVELRDPHAIGVGGIARGDRPGWCFGDESLDDWTDSDAFQFLDSALRSGPVSEGRRRAVLGVRLLVRAAGEHQTDLKMLGMVSALEAWLLTRNRGTQTMLLAQRMAWFGCGRPMNSLCGRDRPACPYLHLDPARDRDRRRLKTLRDLGNRFVEWRCSEWHQVMDWYDARSGPAHGDDPSAVSHEVAEGAEFWVTHQLAEPILEWLRDHEQDPVGDLANALQSIDDPTGWDTMLGALDSPSPPSIPPLPS